MSTDQQKLIGNYKIVGELGRGGMGVVYKAIQPSLNREVALKVLPPYFAQDKELVERFFREARAAANLKHPKIVTVYDFGQDKETFYFAMELLEGKSLEDLIKKKGSFSLSETEDIISQVADALGYAHKRHIVHRDIKPGNIIINERGDAILTDFGIAKAAYDSSLTQTGTSVGSPEFMSPEQVQGGHVDSRSDLYSLGILLYKLMTGNAPYKGETGISIAVKHLQAPVPSLKSVLSHTPDWLEEIVQRLLAKDPANRYQSAEELIKALKEKKAAAPVVEAADGKEITPPLATIAMPSQGGAAAVSGSSASAAARKKDPKQAPKAKKIPKPATKAGKSPKSASGDSGLAARLGSVLQGIPEERRKLVLIVGSAACVLAIVLIVVLLQPGGARFSPGPEGGPAEAGAGLDYQILLTQAQAFYDQGDRDKALAAAKEAQTLNDTPDIQALIQSIEDGTAGRPNEGGSQTSTSTSKVKPKSPDTRKVKTKSPSSTATRSTSTASSLPAAPDLPAVRLSRPPDTVRDSKPDYPNLARQQKQEGTVVLEVTIDVDGKVINTKILRSSPLFDNAAVRAVQKRIYQPHVVKGQRRTAVFNTAVLFRL